MLPLLWLAATGLVGALPTSELATRQSACAPVHIIVARGSTEAQGEGAMGMISSTIKSAISGADSEGIVYPASLTDYTTSEGQGTAAMTKAIQSYADRCPSSKIVLMGYSQGGQVVFDSLCGTSAFFLTQTAPLASNYGARISAVVVFGDPSHVVGQPWNAGTSTHNGLNPRSNNAACQPYASIIKSYCDSGDIFCDSGLNFLTHLMYVPTYGTDAANFVISKVS